MTEKVDSQSIFSIRTRLLTVLFYLQETSKPSQTAAKILYAVPRSVQAIMPWWFF